MNLGDTVRRTLIVILMLLALATMALSLVVKIVQTHCSFGFGGFQWIAPYVGCGDALITIELLLMGLIPILFLALVWLAFRGPRRR